MRAISEFEADIAALAERLRQVPVGGMVSYSDLNETIGRPVRGHRYLLISARDRVEREDGAIFQSVFNQGVKRLSVESYASVGQYSRRIIRRKARTASRRMRDGIAKANDAPAEVIRAVSREQSVLGLIEFAAKDKTLAKMLNAEPLIAPTPLAKAAQDLMKALGMQMNGD